jgi:hypothetical protein
MEGLRKIAKTIRIVDGDLNQEAFGDSKFHWQEELRIIFFPLRPGRLWITQPLVQKVPRTPPGEKRP